MFHASPACRLSGRFESSLFLWKSIPILEKNCFAFSLLILVKETMVLAVNLLHVTLTRGSFLAVKWPQCAEGLAHLHADLQA